MSTYREIHGKAVKSVSTDPSAETDAGQIWYNTTSDTFKSIVQSEAWSSQSLTSSQHGDGAGCGDVPAVVIWGGYSPDAPPVTASTEEWNGTGWATGGNYPFAGFGGVGSAGTQTAALGIAGRLAPPAGTSSDVTGEYDGSSWTTGGAFPEINYGAGGFGTQTAGVAYGGNNRADAAPSNPSPSSGTMQYTKEYDGSSWTAGNNYPVAVSQGTATGSLTAGIGAGGSNRPDGSAVANSATYDGTNWTAITNIPGVKAALGMTGTQTASIIFGGYPGPTGNQSVQWDGTSWAAAPNLAGPGYGGGSGHNSTPTGSTSALIGARRDGSNYPYATEEFTTSTSVVTAAAWSSGTAFPTNSSGIAGVGPRDAAMAIGGYPPGSPPTGKSFEYNGVAWSAEATLNPNTGTGGVSSAAGTQTAAICTQLPAGGAPYIAAGTYNGTSWSNAEDRPTSNYSDGSAGTLTAGLFFGGGSSPSAYTAATISYDGTDWTVEESMGTARTIVGGCGSSTAALAMGGVVTPPATLTNLTEEYGGESWTAGGTLLTTLRDHRASGPQTDAIVVGGRIGGAPPSVFLTACSRYDGTAWATAPSLAIARGLQGAGNGPVGAAWGAAGYYPGPPSGPTGNRTTSTEHFNVETTALNVKTITTS